MKIKIVSFFSVDHNDIFDNKYFIDPGNILASNITCWNINT